MKMGNEKLPTGKIGKLILRKISRRVIHPLVDRKESGLSMNFGKTAIVNYFQIFSVRYS